MPNLRREPWDIERRSEGGKPGRANAQSQVNILGKKKDSELIRLVTGEDGLLWHSRRNRLLLKFALDAFGEPLSLFLLSGLGEEEEERIWLFTVTFTDLKDAICLRDLRVEADELPDVVTLLPRRHEPLVMLALLHILRSRKPFSSSLFYDQEEVLEVLEWKDTPTSRRSIDETVERYADISYRWALSEKELAEKNLSRGQGWSRFVSGYGYRDVEEEGDGRRSRVANRVDFSAVFINELMSRSLFGVRWNNVISFNRFFYSNYVGGVGKTSQRPKLAKGLDDLCKE